MGAPQPISLSAEDMFDTPDDGNRYEVIEGRLYVTPPPAVVHQEILTRSTFTVGGWVKSQGLGNWYQSPCGVVLDDGTGLQPDAFFIAKHRVAELRQPNAIYGAPDLVIEVLSPSTSRRDLTVKPKAYAGNGVREYWMVSPEAQTIRVLALGPDTIEELGIVTGDSLIPTRVLPGLPVRARELFED